MTHRVELAEEAEEEVRDAIAFYRTIGMELARDFRTALRQTVARVRARPSIGPPHRAGTRRILLPRFPYAVIYDVGRDVITIIAVTHHRRDPEYWVQRLKARSQE